MAPSRTSRPVFPGPGRAGPLWEMFFRFGPPRWSQYIRSNWAGQRLVIATPYFWLLLFFLIPFLIVLKISVAELAPLGRPPYEPILRWLFSEILQDAGYSVSDAPTADKALATNPQTGEVCRGTANF